jgi:hypothetical protein
MQTVLILLRLWVLWDRKTRLVLVTLPLFLVTQITAIVCTTYVVSSMMRESSYDCVQGHLPFRGSVDGL